MGVNGLLTDVRWEWTGTELSADVVAGATVLPVLDPTAITEGEVVWVADTGPYEIVNSDEDTDTFTITPGLATDADNGAAVANDVGGQPGRVWVGEVILDDAFSPVEVPLTIHDLSVMPEGTYDPPVTIVVSDDLQSVENLPGSLPIIDGIYIPPESLPPPLPPGPTAAPAVSPALTVIPQDSGFVLQTGPVTNGYSTLTYHAGAPGFTPDATTVVKEDTRSQNVLIPTLPDGSAFVRGTTYAFRVVESNELGDAPPSAEKTAQLRVYGASDIPDLAGVISDVDQFHVIKPNPVMVNNSPVDGSIAWPAFTVEYQNVDLAVPPGDTLTRWVIYRWNSGVPTIEKSSIQHPILNPGDFMLFGNNGGVAIRIFTAVVVDGDMLVKGSVTSEAIATGAITAEKIGVGEINADMIESGELSATIAVLGSLSVGPGITITPDNGIVVTGPQGESIIPTNGGPIQFAGDVVMFSATVLGNWTMRGTSNEIATGAELVVQAGTTPPMAGPQITAEYPQHKIHEGYNGRGLCPFPAWGANAYLQTETLNTAVIGLLNKQTFDDPANGNFIGDYVFGWSNYDCKVDGNRPEITSGLGGVTALGTEVYVLCETNEALPGTYRGRWYVYQFHFNGGTGAPNTKFSYVRRWIYEPHSTLGANSTWRPCIGNDGTNLLIAQSSTLNYWIVSRYDPSGGYIGLANLYEDAAKTQHVTAGRNITGIVGTAADTGTLCWYIASENFAYVYCQGTNAVRANANDFSAPSTPMYGLMWDGTRFVYRTGTTTADFSRIRDTDLATNPIKVVQTWRLDNPADTATAEVGDFAMYETSKSPASSSNAFPKRAWLRLNSVSPIPDEPGDPNDPDSLTFYVARGTAPANIDYRRLPPATGANKKKTTVLLDILPTSGLPPPLLTNFGTATPGRLKASGQDVDGAYWRLDGNGAGRSGPYIWNSSGKLTKGLPCCSVVNTVNQNVPASAETTMIYNTVEYDTDNMTAQYATGFLTIQTAGIYMATICTVYASTAGGSRITLLRQNNTNIRRWGYNVSELTAETITHSFKAVPGDVISFRQYQSSGATMALPGGAYFPSLQLLMISNG